MLWGATYPLVGLGGGRCATVSENLPIFMGSKLNQLDRPPKRVRTEVLIPDKTPGNQSKYPKFLVIHSESDKQLSKLSPFLVAKVLESVVGKKFKAKKMSSGDLLVEIETSEQSTALLALNSVSDHKVSVTPHRTLNTIQGVISEEDLLETTDNEIAEGLSDQGVVAARRICMRRDGQEIRTKHIVLTFEATTLPEAVKAGYLHCRVRPYIPNPRRCFQCQKYGHGSQNCRRNAVIPTTRQIPAQTAHSAQIVMRPTRRTPDLVEYGKMRKKY